LCIGSQVQSSNNSQVPYLTIPTLQQETCKIIIYISKSSWMLDVDLGSAELSGEPM
jgi:hypothetical protein